MELLMVRFLSFVIEFEETLIESSDANGKLHQLITYKTSKFATFNKLVPTINGYKRLVGGEAFWAPNAVTYGYDSRAASIRIIAPPSCPPSATRFEIRVPGADMNPYFALSTIFSLGLRGIKKKLPLSCPPISHFTPEDRKTGKVGRLCFHSCQQMIHSCSRSRCCRFPWNLRRSE